MTYIKRTLERKFLEVNNDYSCIILIGPRQVGKTTVLKHFAEEHPEINYVTLDYPKLRLLAREDPELFLQQYHHQLTHK